MPGGRVLLVEDDVLVRLLAVEALTDGGFDVAEAADGLEALRLLDGGEFDLMITDVGLPGMTGAELAAQVRRERPSLKVLFTTGYGAEDGVPQDLPTLRKPYAADALAATVRLLLAPDA
ncbi:response regulator [Inquilinus limosus]|uniref:response regulator n=1 Tax=Inquilinus limosus TaxID=171674 RepID=UPI003F156DD2